MVATTSASSIVNLRLVEEIAVSRQQPTGILTQPT
jgi:hypothetical protein